MSDEDAEQPDVYVPVGMVGPEVRDGDLRSTVSIA
jgi:hypothetical protein